MIGTVLVADPNSTPEILKRLDAVGIGPRPEVVRAGTQILEQGSLHLLAFSVVLLIVAAHLRSKRLFFGVVIGLALLVIGAVFISQARFNPFFPPALFIMVLFTWIGWIAAYLPIWSILLFFLAKAKRIEQWWTLLSFTLWGINNLLHWNVGFELVVQLALAIFVLCRKSPLPSA
jgi:hypothetical protein